MTRARAAGVLIVATLTVAAFYVVVYPLHGYRVAVGSDTPVYVWWSRFAGASGLGGVWTGPRSGIVGPLAALAGVTGIDEGDLVAAIGPVLAMIVGLAAGAFVEAGLGPNRIRLALTVVLTGTFLSLLAPGYFSTLAFGSAFVAGLAALTTGLAAPTGRPIAAAAALFGAAGLSHVLFLVVAAAILAGGVIALIPQSRRAAHSGVPWPATPLGRAISASAGGAVVVVAGLAVSGSLVDVLTPGSDAPVTSRDTVLRRTGLRSLLETSYRRKLAHDFRWYRAATVLGVAALPFARRDRRGLLPRSGEPSPGGWFFWGAVGAWVAVTAAALGGMALGLAAPGQRLAAFCIPLPVLGAMGLARIRPRRPGGPRAGAALALAALIAIGFVAVAWLAWEGEEPLATPAQVTQAREAGAALARRPEGTPLILVADDRSDKPTLLVVRHLNYLRAAVPGARVTDVFAFIGTPDDFLARRPTLTGQAEHDEAARAFWREVRPLLGRDPVAVAVDAFDRRGHRRAERLPGATRLGPGVVALPGFAGPACRSGCPPTEPGLADAGGGPFSPWLPVWLTPALVGLLALVGIPWAVAALPQGRLVLPVVLGPSFGLAALGLASIAVDAAGLRLSSGGGWASFGLALGGGLTAAAAGRRARRLT